MNNNLAILILAAGKGKRMNNPEIPKVLVKLNNQPLLYYVLSQTQKLEPLKTVIVVGHKKEQVIEFCNSTDLHSDESPYKIEYAVQHQQLGTGNAVLVSEFNFDDNDYAVLILAGDVPLLRAETLSRFIQLHSDSHSDCSVLSTIAPNPFGYGRIVRDNEGNFLKITEQKDASEEIKQINEINSGIFLVNSKILFESLKKIKNNNAQNEYYLTDIVEILKNNNMNVNAFACAEFNELQGINTNEELLNAEKYFLDNYK